VERHAPAHEASPAGKVESMLELRRLLGSVSEEMAQACVYHYVDELTQDEIAAVMGCSRRHVGHLLERLRARMCGEVGRP